MAEHAGFAGAITVREHVLRIALQAGYANSDDTSKRFTQSLSDDTIEIEPDLFLGPLDIDLEGATNLLVAKLPMWGTMTVTTDGAAHVVEAAGEMELTLTPAFTTGRQGTDRESSVILDQLATVVEARRWTAVVTTAATPPDVAAIVVGDEFRTRFEDTFRRGVALGLVTLPAIDASFLGPVVRRATAVEARVRDGVLLIGLNRVAAGDAFDGDPEQLEDFARGHDVAGVVHPDAVHLLLEQVRHELEEGVDDAGATLDDFTVGVRDGFFHVSGAVSKSTGTVNFSFRVVPSMFHTRPGALFSARKPVRVHSRTWAALGFTIEDVQTDVDRPWWLILFGEVIGGILTVGWSVLLIEDMVSSAAASFSGKIERARPGAATARVRRTVPPPGGIGVRVGLDVFEVTESGVHVGISVRAKPSPAVLFGPKIVPDAYRNDTLRYILRPPSGVAKNDPALRIRWMLEDRVGNVVLADADGVAKDRLQFEFSPSSFATTDLGVVARLYRRVGVEVTELATESVNLHIRSGLPPGAYVRWRWQGTNPQVAVDDVTDRWTFHGMRRVDRYSEWHRTDAPCRAVNAPARFRYQFEEADRLPFSLRKLENHRKGLCPYCFFGGPAGINARL